MPAFPSPVPTYHNDIYPAINPTNPSLSTKGKSVVISGGATGIGAAIAEAFGKSGASSISILGRTAKTLEETAGRLQKQYPNTAFHHYVADIINREAVIAAFKSIKHVDIPIASAGYLPDLGPLAKSDATEWYEGFEINVRGNYNLISAFLPVAAPNAAVVHLTSGVVHLPWMPGYSSYHTSKLAGAKLFDYVHAEHPDFFVLNVSPGVIKTGMELKTRAAGVVFEDLDTVELPGGFVVWAVSDEAKFLNGKLVWANWDVEELKGMRKEIEGTDKFTLGLIGWP